MAKIIADFASRNVLWFLRATVRAAAMLLVSGLATGAHGESAFRSGMKSYQRLDFVAAIQAFEQAVQQAPRVSRFHHWLGKAYGRLAQHSNWLRTLTLAKQAKRALETAVELDPNNAAALADLLSYYEQAPSFLGGDEAKAKTLRQRLATLKPGAERKQP
ncbi:MAG: hypothetical protein ACREYF_19590 [Gammaproteobacteria bacterium]